MQGFEKLSDYQSSYLNSILGLNKDKSLSQFDNDDTDRENQEKHSAEHQFWLKKGYDAKIWCIVVNSSNVLF